MPMMCIEFDGMSQGYSKEKEPGQHVIN